MGLVLGACGDDAKEGGKGHTGDKDAGGGAGTGSAEKDAGPQPEPEADLLPTPTGECPGFADGDGCTKDDQSLICTFQPKDVAMPRKVRIYVSDVADDKDGPIFVYWHGLGGNATHVTLPNAGLGQEIVDEILDMGGVVISPEKEEGRSTSLQSLPWYLAAQGIGPEDDLFVMDDAVGCVLEKFGGNVRRIYSTGMSAGALQTGQVVLRRDGYIAAAAIFSGGMAGLPKLQNKDNKLPVALFYGGESDVIGGLHFANNIPDMQRRLDKNGQFYMTCNHDSGHILPPDCARAGFEFMMAHPYGVEPEPYADGLPESFPDFCMPPE